MNILDRSNRYRTFFLVLSGVLIFCLMHFRYAYHLLFLEQHQLFLSGKEYAMELLPRPGGAIEYVSEYLIQFFTIHYIGEICSTILLLLIGCSFYSLIKRKQDTNWPIFIFEGFTILFLLINLLDITFYFRGITGYLFCLIALVIYNRIDSSIWWKRILCGSSFAFILFYVAAPFQTLFLITAGCIEIRKYGLNKGKSLLFWILLAVSAYLVILILGKGVYRSYIGLDAICSFRIIPGWTKYIAWVLLPVSIFFTPLMEKMFCKTGKTYWIVSVQCLIILSAAIYLLPRYEDAWALPIKRLNLYATQEKWEDILDYCKKDPSDEYICLNYQNLSLAKKGILADSLLAYPQNGAGGLFSPWDRTAYTAFVLQEICYNYGSIAFTQRYAFEGNVSSITMGFPQTMKMLIRTNILQKEYTVAAKYLRYLQQTFSYKDWANEQCGYLSGTKDREENPEYRDKQKYLHRDNYLLLENDLFTLAKMDKGNTALRDFVLCYYLLDKNLEKFLAWLRYYYDKGSIDMPTVYYEAIMACAPNVPDVLQQFTVPEKVKERFDMYANIYDSTQDSKERKEWLSLYFSDSYWFYFHYKEIEHV